MRTVVVDGGITFSGYDQVLGSNLFRKIIGEFLEELQERSDPLLKAVEVFRKKDGYDLDSLVNAITLLTVRHLSELEGPVWNFLRSNASIFVDFVESLYNFWRSKHRFMVRIRPFHRDPRRRVSEEYALMENGERFETILREMYRSVLRNTKVERLKVLRQLPSGVQAMFLAMNGDERTYGAPLVWSVILKPPVIFYTRSNKRRGVFPVKEGEVSLDASDGWLAFPIHVGKYRFLVLVEQDRLCHGAGLSNLFELAEPDGEFEAVVVFGYPVSKLKEDERNGVVFQGERYVGVVSDLPHTDYFGYMKKMILTVHNLMVIDEGRLPVHGALAKIDVGGKEFAVMFVGDSGAGKSETLEALRRMGARVETIVDDMASLDITEEGVVSYGTEVGAFVRLDDLPPGYAYSTMDRSIFMNPDQTNARVIVPFGNYEKIVTPTRIDLFLYANNYEPSDEKIRVFKNVDEALEVFSAGKRMAKGTTSEVGITSTYFANPFGAVQRREKHEEIARRFLEEMFRKGVVVGEIRTMLGIPGYERRGPDEAAKALMDFLRTL